MCRSQSLFRVQYCRQGMLVLALVLLALVVLVLALAWPLGWLTVKQMKPQAKMQPRAVVLRIRIRLVPTTTMHWPLDWPTVKQMKTQARLHLHAVVSRIRLRLVPDPGAGHAGQVAGAVPAD